LPDFLPPLVIIQMASMNAINDPFSPSEGGELGEFDLSQPHVSSTIHGSYASTYLPSIEQGLVIYDDPSQAPNTTSSLEKNDARPEKLALLQLAEWDHEKIYDEVPPSCLRYTIEWKVTVNKKMIAKDTEQDVVLAPAPYWENVLQPRLEQLLQKKVYPSKCFRADDTGVVVAVTDQSERDLTKRFDEAKIDWSIIEKQLMAWGNMFRAGKRLRVHLSFNYIETVPISAPSVSRKENKKGCSFTTQRMLGERAA
jgi:hypothetical protein